MLSRLALARLLAAVVGGLLAFATAGAVGVPATAASNVIISGTVTNSDGAPVGGVRVWAESAPSSVTTDTSGRFSFPVSDGTNTRLGMATPMSASLQGSSLAVYTQTLTVAGNLNIGTATLPPLQTKTVRVVDSAGTPVYGADLYASGDPLDADWVDAGHQLTPELQVASGSFSVSATTNGAGEVTMGFPRLADNKLPPVPVYFFTDGGSVYNANLSEATGTNPHLVTISGFTVGPPTAPVVQATTENVQVGEVAVSYMHTNAVHNGSAVTGYTVTASPGGATQSVPPASSPVIMRGLVGGTTYTFTVTAHSNAGSTTSLPSNPVTVTSPPSAPPGLTATLTGPGQVTVTWETTNGNGSPVTGYQVSAWVLTGIPAAADQRSVVINGVPAGTHAVSVLARNNYGNGPPATTTITMPGAGPAIPPPTTGTTTATPPTSPIPIPTSLPPGPVPKPTAKVKVKGNKVTVSWSAPNDASGGPVTRYLIAATPGKDKTVTGAARRVVFKNLKPGKYKFTVTGLNAAGKGPTSQSVKIVVPRRR